MNTIDSFDLYELGSKAIDSFLFETGKVIEIDEQNESIEYAIDAIMQKHSQNNRLAIEIKNSNNAEMFLVSKFKQYFTKYFQTEKSYI